MQNQNQQLSSYIRSQLELGSNSNDISTQLLNAGWPQDQITAAFEAVQQSIMPTQPNPENMQAEQGVNTTTPVALGKRRGRIRTGWQLLMCSVSLLNGNRYLFRYLVMTWVVIIALETAFVATMWFGIDLFTGSDGSDTALWYVFLALAYILVCFIINLYAAALSANILDIYSGKRDTYSTYMHRARSKMGPIFIFSVFQAAVGLFLEYVVERIRFIGWIVSWLLGTLWSLMTMFTLPIIMDSDKGVIQSVKESTSLFKKTWGENITAKASVNTPIGLIQIALAVIFWSAILPVIFLGRVEFLVLLIVLYLFLAISIAMIGSFANSVINMALYYYATQAKIPPGFTAEMLNKVFVEGKHGRKATKK